MSVVWRVLLALGAAVLVAACSSSAASDGAVPLDELHGSSTSAPGTEGAAPDPAADRGTADGGPTGTDPVVAAVADVLGGQAAISRPVGDDGSRPEVRDDRVFILGDSIVESAGPGYYDTIRQQLLPLGWRPTIDAQRGRTTPEGLRVLQQRRRDVHDVAVVLLGHNDAVDPTAYRARVDAIVDELADVRLVLLLTNYEFEPGRGRMNDQLRVVDSLHDNVELVDWNAVVKATPGAIGPDGLHLTRTGARALGATLAVALGLAPDGAAKAVAPTTT
jgi:lysophospholipase L1-like esterase